MPKRVYRMDLPRTDFNATHMPTESEIRRECEKIQTKWSSKEREQRTASAFRKVRAKLAEGFVHQQGQRVDHRHFGSS